MSEFEKPTEPILRTASLEDLGSIVPFLETAYADTYPNDRGITRDMFAGNEEFLDELKTYFEKQLSDRRVQLYTATLTGEIVGTIGLRPMEDSSVLELWGFYVSKDLHGKGLAQQLFDHAMQAKETASAERIQLTVAKDAARAKAFYEKQGFVVTGDEDWDWPHWTKEHPHNQYWIMQKILVSE